MTAARSHRTHVALIGMAGVGKTSVGRRLARALRMPWVDLDSLIELRAGRSVADIFSSDGEPAFRRAEAEALETVLGEDAPRVVSTGGGVVLAHNHAELLRGGATTVWLRASDETLVERIRRSSKVRPLLLDDPEGNVARLNQERSEAYERCADLVVDVDGLDLGGVVRQVLAGLGSHESVESGDQATAP